MPGRQFSVVTVIPSRIRPPFRRSRVHRRDRHHCLSSTPSPRTQNLGPQNLGPQNLGPAESTSESRVLIKIRKPAQDTRNPRLPAGHSNTGQRKLRGYLLVLRRRRRPEEQTFTRQARQRSTHFDGVADQFDCAPTLLRPVFDQIVDCCSGDRVVEGLAGQPDPYMHLTEGWEPSVGRHACSPPLGGAIVSRDRLLRSATGFVLIFRSADRRVLQGGGMCSMAPVERVFDEVFVEPFEWCSEYSGCEALLDTGAAVDGKNLPRSSDPFVDVEGGGIPKDSLAGGE